MQTQKIKRLNQEKQKVAGQLPPFKEVLRGTFIQCYLKCIRPNCKCHQAKKYRHGPYYRVSYGKGKRMHHIYVPLKMKSAVKRWTDNYREIWDGIEKISALNIRLIREKSGK